MEIPILTRLKARNLYLIQGLSHQEIAEQTGLTRQGSEQLAHREGWVKAKRERCARLTQKHDERMEQTAGEALDAIAAVSEQHAMQGLARVGESLADRSDFAARNFQSWTGGVKNLVSIMREIRAPQESAAPGSQLNVFVVRACDATPATPRNVTPASAEQPAIELPKV